MSSSVPGGSEDVFVNKPKTFGNKAKTESSAFSELNTDFFDVDDPETIREFLMSLSADEDEASLLLTGTCSQNRGNENAADPNPVSFEFLGIQSAVERQTGCDSAHTSIDHDDKLSNADDETPDSRQERLVDDQEPSDSDDLDVLLARLAEEAHALSCVLKGMADDLDKHNFNVNVSKIAGNAATIAGTGIAIAGGVLGFFTLGASLPLVLAGSALAASGGIASLTSFVVDQVISRKRLRQAEEMYSAFIHDMEPLTKGAPTIGPDDMVKPARDTVNIGNVAFTAIRLAKSGQGAAAAGGAAAEAAGAGTATAFNTLGVVGRLAHVGGLAVNTVLLPLSILDLVKASVAVHRKTDSPAGSVIRELVATLEKIADVGTLSTELGAQPHDAAILQGETEKDTLKEDRAACRQEKDSFTSSDPENGATPDDESDFEHIEDEDAPKI